VILNVNMFFSTNSKVVSMTCNNIVIVSKGSVIILLVIILAFPSVKVEFYKEYLLHIFLLQLWGINLICLKVVFEYCSYSQI
jgi:hypothetical protein